MIYNNVQSLLLKPFKSRLALTGFAMMIDYFARGGFNLEHGYLENGNLEGFLTSNIRATAISKNSNCFHKNNHLALLI